MVQSWWDYEAGLVVTFKYRVRNLAVDAKGFMHWRFWHRILVPMDRRLRERKKKKFIFPWRSSQRLFSLIKVLILIELFFLLSATKWSTMLASK